MKAPVIKTLKASLLGATSLVLTACSPTQILSQTSGADNYLAVADLAYGPLARQKLDIYRGETTKCRVLFVYGGGWQEGDKHQYGFVGAQLAKLGYEVVIPDYRLYPQVQHPSFIEDIALSIQYLEDHQPTSLPLVMMGHSAGAMIASMVSYQPKYLQQQGVRTDVIAANVAIAGPHDYFLPTDKPEWVNIFGADPSQQVDGLTVNHLSHKAPLSLILHGQNDKIVTPKSAISLHQKLTALGVQNELKLYDNAGHRRIIAAMAYPLHFLAPTLDDIDQFLSEQVCNKTTYTPPAEQLAAGNRQ